MPTKNWKLKLTPNHLPKEEVIMKTHEVLDLHYLPEEGQGCFAGTLQECEDFAATQTPFFMYKVVPMTKDEINLYNQLENKPLIP